MAQRRVTVPRTVTFVKTGGGSRSPLQVIVIGKFRRTMPKDYKKNCPCPHHPFRCFGHPTTCECANGAVDYDEALRLIRKHMQPGDTLGKMFMRVARALEKPDGKRDDLAMMLSAWQFWGEMTPDFQSELLDCIEHTYLR